MKRFLLKPLHNLFLWLASALIMLNLSLGYALPQPSNLVAQVSDRKPTETSRPNNPQTQKNSEQAKSDSAVKRTNQPRSDRADDQNSSQSPGPYDMEKIKRFNRDLYGS